MTTESKIRQVLADNPQLAEAVLQARKLPAKQGKYRPQVLQILFDGVLVCIRQEGRPPFDLMLPSDYRPEVIEFYGDDELLLVKANGAVLLNRLPKNLEWTTYALN